MLPDLLFCSLFPVQQTTSGIGHRVKYFFRVGNQYVDCEKQQQQKAATCHANSTVQQAASNYCQVAGAIFFHL